MSSMLNPHLPFRVTDNNGKVVPGAKVFVYQAGTTTDATVYQDNALSSAHPQPVVANSSGIVPPIYAPPGQLYKVVVTDASDVEIFNRDNITPYVASDGGVLPVNGGGTNASTAAGARANLQAAFADDVTAISGTVASINGERTAVGGQFRALAGREKLVATDFGTNLDGVVVQEVRATTAVQSTTASALIPTDNTVPQITEGEEIISTAFTPKRADTTMEIEIRTTISQAGAAVVGVVAVFVSTNDGALNVGVNRMEQSNPADFSVRARHQPNSVTPITYSARVGGSAARAFAINTPSFGGAAETELIIREIYKPS